MIQVGSFLNVADNSGAKKVLCIKQLSGSKKRYGYVGDIILVSIKSIRSKRRAFSKVKKGEILKAIIIRTKHKLYDKFKNNIFYFQNSVVLMTRQNKAVGTRVFGSLPRMFRFTKYNKLISLSKGLTS